MKNTIFLVLFLTPVLVYLAGWLAFLFHFHAKFKYFNLKWHYAHKTNDRQSQDLYFECEMLANKDTSLSMLWPLILNRWNADYVAEARAIKSGRQLR